MIVSLSQPCNETYVLLWYAAAAAAVQCGIFTLPYHHFQARSSLTQHLRPDKSRTIMNYQKYHCTEYTLNIKLLSLML